MTTEKHDQNSSVSPKPDAASLKRAIKENTEAYFASPDADKFMKIIDAVYAVGFEDGFNRASESIRKSRKKVAEIG